MPNIKITKQSLEPRANLPAGIYEFILDGFKPGLSKGANGKEKTINLQPTLRIINNSGVGTDGKPLNGQRIFENLNVAFPPRLVDFVHAFGDEMVDTGDGNLNIPGEFVGPEEDPSKWSYQGPLVGKQGRLEIAERIYNGKPQADIKRYFCQLPGCTFNHMESLIKA